jgi:hypothetical protein
MQGFSCLVPVVGVELTTKGLKTPIIQGFFKNRVTFV